MSDVNQLFIFITVYLNPFNKFDMWILQSVNNLTVIFALPNLIKVFPFPHYYYYYYN